MSRPGPTHRVQPSFPLTAGPHLSCPLMSALRRVSVPKDARPPHSPHCSDHRPGMCWVETPLPVVDSSQRDVVSTRPSSCLQTHAGPPIPPSLLDLSRHGWGSPTASLCSLPSTQDTRLHPPPPALHTLCPSALPGTLLPASFVHQSALLGALEGDSSWNDPPSPGGSPSPDSEGPSPVIRSQPDVPSLEAACLPPAPPYTLTICFSTSGSYRVLSRFFICLFTPNPTHRMGSFTQEHGVGSCSLPPRQAPSHPVSSLSVARDPWERAEPGLPLGPPAADSAHPRAPGRQAVPSPAPWIHTLRLSRDSQAGTVLPQGSEMLETHKKREV